MTDSPGQAFYKAYAEDPTGARVQFDYTITEAFMPVSYTHLTLPTILRV